MLCLLLTLLFQFVISISNHVFRKLLSLVIKLIPVIVFGGVVLYILVQNGFLIRFVNTFNILANMWSLSHLQVKFAQNANILVSERFYFWGIAWRLFLTSPLFGIGWGKFADFGTDRIFNVHNLYLQLLCETGVFGFLLIIVPIVLLFVVGVKKCRKIIKFNKGDRLSDLSLFMATSMMFFLILINFMDPTFHRDFYSIFMIIMISLVEYPKSAGRSPNMKNI